MNFHYATHKYSKSNWLHQTSVLIFEESLQWRHNEHDVVSNHQPHDCLLNRLFKCRSKNTSKLHVTGLCEGNSPVTDEFLAQRASNAENVSILWRQITSINMLSKCHHVLMSYFYEPLHQRSNPVGYGQKYHESLAINHIITTKQLWRYSL